MREPRLLFLSIANSVGCDRLPSAMIERGARCALVSPPGFYSALVAGYDRMFRLPPNRRLALSCLAVRHVLPKAAETFRPDFIVPLDDQGALLLRGLVIRRLVDPPLLDLLVRSLGAEDGYDASCSRVSLMDQASSLGILIPTYGDDAPLPVFMKEDRTSAGAGTVLVPHDATVARPYSRFKWFRRWGRNRVWHAAGFPVRTGTGWLRQSGIRGRLAVCNVVALNGRVLDHFSYIPQHVMPAHVGSSTTLNIVNLPDVGRASIRLIENLGYSGFANLDYIVDERGCPYLIEMNARCSGTTHLGSLGGHDLCSALLNGLTGRVSTPADGPGARATTVALFPNEFLRNPRATVLPGDGWTHDVPLTQPAVFDAYLSILARKYGCKYADDLRARISASVTPIPVHRN